MHYEHRDSPPRRVLTSPKLGEKRRNDDFFDGGQRYKRLAFQRRLDGWYAPPRPFEMSHPRLFIYSSDETKTSLVT